MTGSAQAVQTVQTPRRMALAPVRPAQAAQRSGRAFKRLVEGRIEEARIRLAGAGIEAEINAGWSSDRRHLIVRCSVLRAGEVDPVAREHSAFAGGYLLRHLSDLGVRPQFGGNVRHLLVPYPSPSAAGAV